MQPVRTKFTSEMLGAPKGWDERQHGPCVGLPILRTEDPYLVSWWRPSWRERLAVFFGKPVRLCVVGGNHPPVALDVTDEW